MSVVWHGCSADRIADVAAAYAQRLTSAEKLAPEDIIIPGINEVMLGAIRNRAGFPEGVSVSPRALNVRS
jgi:hypothetical protein